MRKLRAIVAAEWTREPRESLEIQGIAIRAASQSL